MLTLTKSTGRSKEEILKQSKSQRQESHKKSSTLHYFTTTFTAPKGPLHSVTPPQHKTMIYHKQEENTCSKVHFLSAHFSIRALQRHSAEARTNSCLLLLLSSPCAQNILCEWTGYSVPDWQLTCFIYFIFNTEHRLVFTNVNRRALQSTENNQPAVNQNSGNSKYPSPVILTWLSFKRGTPPCA